MRKPKQGRDTALHKKAEKQEEVKLKKKRHKINWHHAVYEALKIELKEYEKDLEFHEEYHLGKSKDSLRADVLVIKKPSDLHISKKIAEKFQTYNIIEYKSPGDNLSVDDYYKVMAYGGIFRSNTGKVNEIENKDITLTFITSRFPQKLKNELKNRKIPLVKRAPGIYDISEDVFPTQLIVNRQLDEDESLWLRCLDNQLKEKELYERLEKEYKQHKNETRYAAPMNAIIWSNLEQEGERNVMCEALYDLFADELVEYEARGKAQGIKIGETQGMEQEKRTVARNLLDLLSDEVIAERVGLDIEEVHAMRN